MKKLIFFLWLLTVIVLPAKGQVVSDPALVRRFSTVSEVVQLTTDRTLYLPGETVWFSGFVSVSTTAKEGISKVLYIEMFDKEGNAVVKKKSEVSHGLISGGFKIPDELVTGNYVLCAYTQFNRNHKLSGFFSKPLLIVNPEIPLSQGDQPDTVLSHPDPVKSLNSEIFDFEGMTISGLKPEYSKRELVNFTVNKDTALFKGIHIWCLSVVKSGTLLSHQTTDLKSGNDAKNDSFDSLFWLPETREVSLSGMIRDQKTGEPVPGWPVFMSVPGANPQFQICRTQNKGEFLFSLNRLGDSAEIVISAERDSVLHPEIMVNRSFANSKPLNINYYSLPDENSRNLITEMYINQQVCRLSGKPAKPVTGLHRTTLFNAPDYTVKLRDFVELGTMQEVFRELVPQVTARLKHGRYFLQMLNEETGRLIPCRYVFLDNVLITDINQLMDIPPSKIEKIEVINRSYYLGDFVLDGMVMIYTQTNNFAGYRFTGESVFVDYQGFSFQETFETISHENRTNTAIRYPDFRTSLLWVPELRFVNGKSAVSFFTSDHSSDYDLILYGLSADGIITLKAATFLVN